MGMLYKVEEVWRKNCLYDELKCEWAMHSEDDLVMCLGGHIDRYIDGVHEGYGVGQRNFEGKMLPEFCLEKELFVSDTWLLREEKRLVTFRMVDNETEIDFVLMKKSTGCFCEM